MLSIQVTQVKESFEKNKKGSESSEVVVSVWKTVGQVGGEEDVDVLIGMDGIRIEGARVTAHERIFRRRRDGDSGYLAEVGTGRQEAWSKNKEEI